MTAIGILEIGLLWIAFMWAVMTALGLLFLLWSVLKKGE